MSIPIIFVHVSNTDYLIYSLLQAKHSNPQSNIFLIGDYKNNYYRFVEHINIMDYFYNARELAKIYKHYHNRNPHEYELFCFQRWFIIRDFMLANNIDKCLCLDSDVMLYANLVEEEKNFSEFDLTLSQSFSPHCVFVKSLSALEKFCKFVVNLYTNCVLLKGIEDTLQEYIHDKVACGVSDMTVFNVFKETKECQIGEITTVIDGSRYDHNINLSEGFEVCNGIKKVYFFKGQPFGKQISTGQYIKFNALHFQGNAKKFMQNHFTGKLILDEKTIILPFKLGKTNLIIFPDWTASEKAIHRDLEQVIRAITTHPARSQMTLLVDTDKISDEEAELVLSSVTLNLLMESDLDVSEGPDIYQVGKLGEIQWETLIPRLHARITLENENQQEIAAVKAETIPICALDNLQKIL